MLVPRAKCKRAAWRGPPWRNRDRSRPGTEYDDPVQKRRVLLRTLTAAALAAVACLSVPLLLTSCRPPAPPPAPLDAAVPARPPLPPPVNPPALPALKVPQGGEWDRLAQLTDELKRTEAAALAQRLREQAQSQGQQDAWAYALLREVQLRAGDQAAETVVRLLRAEKWPEAPLPRLLVELFYAHSLLAYLQRYGYEIRQRERVTGPQAAEPADGGPAVDLKAWSYDQIVAAAQGTLARLWRQREALGGTPVAALAPFVTANNFPAEVRGTLRDTLTYLIVELLTDSSHWRPEQNDLYRLDFVALLNDDPQQAAEVRLDDQAVHPLQRAFAALRRIIEHCRSPEAGGVTASDFDKANVTEDLLDLVAALHPTPAVGGLPRDRAAQFLSTQEPFSRGLYAAPVGYFDLAGDGAFWVAIRSALICGSRAWLYAGAGVVAGSIAQKEWAETNAKCSAMRSALGVTI
mgnify:CR=1 FL=1